MRAVRGAAVVVAGGLLLAACGFGATGEAADITHTSARLTGEVDLREKPGTVTWWFEYGTTPEYGSATEVATLAIVTRTPVEAVVDGLSPRTTYHYRICIDDDEGVGSCGKDRTFETTAPPDTVVGNALANPGPSAFGLIIDAASDADGGNPRGNVTLYIGAAGGQLVGGPVTCLRVVGQRAAIGWDATTGGDGLAYVEQAGANGRSRFEVTFVSPAPTVCPDPPTGDFGILADVGGFQVVDSLP